MDSSATGRPSRERDFLEELQRQRDEVADDGAYPSTPAQRADERPGGRRGGGAAGRALGRRAGAASKRRRRPTTPTTWRSRASSAASEPGRRDGRRSTRWTRPDPGRGLPRRARARSSRGSPPPAPARAASPESVTLVAVSKTVAGRCAARRGGGRARPPRGEPGPGGRGQGARGAGRALAARRAAPVEQGAPGARGLRRDPVGGLGRARRAARPARPRGRGPGDATRSCSRSTSTSIRPRPGFAPARSTRRSAELAALPHLERRRADDGRPAHCRPGRGPAHVRAACASSRSGAASRWPELGPALSMGMSDDFELAIEEGATIVRVGRALFGERPGTTTDLATTTTHGDGPVGRATAVGW